MNLKDILKGKRFKVNQALDIPKVEKEALDVPKVVFEDLELQVIYRSMARNLIITTSFWEFWFYNLYAFKC